MSASKETSTPVGAVERVGGKPRVARRPKSRKFYLVRYKAHARAKGMEHLNEEAVFGQGYPKTFQPPGLFDRGFRDYPVVPRYRVSKRLGRLPCDIEQHGAYWLVSDKAKCVLSELSEVDFKFMALDTEVDPGQQPMTLWLCEIMTMLDAADESRSKVIINKNDMGNPVYHIRTDMILHFYEDIVGQHRAFRLNNNFGTIVCDSVFKDKVKDARLSGLRYQDLAPT